MSRKAVMDGEQSERVELGAYIYGNGVQEKKQISEEI